MHINEYIEKALATEAPVGNFISVVLQDDSGLGEYKIVSNVIRGLHGAIGLATEAAELNAAWELHNTAFQPFDLVNGIEEVGDGFWYCALLRAAEPERLGALSDPALNLPTLSRKPKLGRHIRQLAIKTGTFLDLYKRWLFYPKPPADDVFIALFSDIEWHLATLGLMLGGDIYDIRERNIRKLTDKQKGRYKMGQFNSEEAINRDTTNERHILELGNAAPKHYI